MEHNDIFKVNAIITFEYKEVIDTPDPHEGYLAFVPGQGFQQAKYYSGSKTWKSLVTGHMIEPTHYLKLVK